MHYVESIKETVPASRCQLFHDQFRRSVTGYNILELSHMPAETFIYDWYAKNLGQIKSTGVTLNSSKWAMVVGNKTSSDNAGDAKSIMKLIVKLASKEQIDDLNAPVPDAAKDPNYKVWEMRSRGITKALAKLANDYLILKERKVGNVKTLSVGAMARRWKMLKYVDPTESDISGIRSAAASSSSSSSKSKSCSSSSSATARKIPLQKGSKVRVSV